MDDEIMQPSGGEPAPAAPSSETESAREEPKPEETPKTEEVQDSRAAAAAPDQSMIPSQPSPAPTEATPEIPAEPEAVPASASDMMPPPPSAPAPQAQSTSPDLNSLRKKANAERTARRADHLQQILSFASTKSNFSNQDIRDLLHISQSSASTYLSGLVKQGKLKRQGRARAARYSL